MNRREFMKAAGATASLWALPLKAHAGVQGAADIYEIKDPLFVNGTKPQSQYVNEAKVKQAMDSLVMAMTGKSSAGLAWQAIFPGITLNSKIAIKVNALKDLNAPQIATLKAMMQGFASMFNNTFRVSPQNVFLFDNNLGIGGSTSTNHVDSAYGAANLDALKIWHGIDAYAGPAIAVSGKTLYVSTKLSEADYCINFLAPRRHQWYAGNLSGVIKNMMGAVSLDKTAFSALQSGTGSFHDNSNYGGFVDLFKNYCLGHTQLYVADMILIPKDEGANYFDKIGNILAIGTNPCAIDSYIVDILKTFFTTTITKNVPQALATAGLGSINYAKVPVTVPGFKRRTSENEKEIMFQGPAGKTNSLIFAVPKTSGTVDLEIFDCLGARMRTFSQVKDAKVRWDGRNRLGKPVAPGHYWVTLISGNQRQTGKMTIGF